MVDVVLLFDHAEGLATTHEVEYDLSVDVLQATTEEMRGQTDFHLQKVRLHGIEYRHCDARFQCHSTHKMSELDEYLSHHSDIDPDERLS